MAEIDLVVTSEKTSQIFDGLSAQAVAERKKRGESNDYEARVSRTYRDILRDNLLNLFNIVLGTLLVIVIASGDYTTAFFAGFSVVTNSFLGTIQEINAKRKLDKLAALSAQTVRVWRGGELKQIPMKEVVKDDVIAIEPGDRIIVDGRVLASNAMEVDESLLTGESDAVFKEVDDNVYSGSFCVAGTGVMVATQVGRHSTINKLSAVAKQYKRTLTPTQQKVSAIVEITVLIMFIFVPMLFVAGWVARLSFLDAVRNAVVFVTSLVPQGLVLVAILSLTIGAIKISRRQTLIQRVNAVESLANATVLCFDKTGTLTRNELRVTQVIPLNGDHETIQREIALYIHQLGHLNRTAGAVEQYIRSHIPNPPTLAIRREIPFTSGRKWGGIVFDDYMLVMGAPERILPEDDPIVERAAQLSREGLRVLAFARLSDVPDDLHIIGLAQPLALIVMSDQVRDDIQETLAAFREEGLSLKVISGDNLETVKAIAKQAGIDVSEAYTGAQLNALSDAELAKVVQRANLFARIEPDTKRRIVAALQAQGEYVAMTGDGVNDVPALKQADIAIVMNDGAQITKDVADIVLLNNAMSTLPLAFREGKETTQTVFGTMKMFLVKNAYNVLLFIFVAFMSLPFPITPVQISWSAFGTVNMPATFIAFGIIRPQYMRHFRRDVLDYIFTAGLLGAAFIALLYTVVYFATLQDVHAARSAVTILVSLYGMMIVWNVQGVNILEPRTFVQHWRVVLISSITTALTILTMYAWPRLFDFTPFGMDHIAIIVFIVAIFELAMLMVALGMKHRYLLYRMWMLFREH